MNFNDSWAWGNRLSHRPAIKSGQNKWHQDNRPKLLNPRSPHVFFFEAIGRCRNLQVGRWRCWSQFTQTKFPSDQSENEKNFLLESILMSYIIETWKTLTGIKIPFGYYRKRNIVGSLYYICWTEDCFVFAKSHHSHFEIYFFFQPILVSYIKTFFWSFIWLLVQCISSWQVASMWSWSDWFTWRHLSTVHTQIQLLFLDQDEFIW